VDMTRIHSNRQHPSWVKCAHASSLEFLFLQVLAVQEKSGVLQGLNVWKFPTGVVEPVKDSALVM
jgi:hypothetical protein